MSRYNLYKICCWAISFTCIQAIVAQQPFHIPFDFDYHQQQAFKVFSLDSNIYLSGIALPKEMPDNERTIYIAKFDDKGQLESHVIYEDDDNGHTYSNNCRDIVHIGDELFMANNNSSNVNDFVSYQLVSGYNLLEDSLRIVHIVESEIEGEKSPSSSVLAKSIDNKLVLVLRGWTLEDDGVDIILKVIDPINNTVDENAFFLSKEFHNYYVYELIESDSEYNLIGYLHREDTNQFSLFCIRLDEEFKLIGEHHFTDLNYIGGTLDAHLSHDEDLMISAIHFTVSNQNDWLYKPISLRLDTDLNILWQLPFGEQDFSGSHTTFTDIKESHDKDGSMLIGFRETGIQNNSVGVIGKISNEGDSIFYKHIQPLDGYYRLALYDMTVTPDGNYLATGNTWSIENQDSVYFEGVLIKFDENGNICDRNKTSTSQIHLPDIELSLYPNPASEVLYIDTGISLKTISILDSQGQLIITKNDLSPSTIYYQSVVNYPSGQYYIHITSNEGLTYIERIIIL